MRVTYSGRSARADGRVFDHGDGLAGAGHQDRLGVALDPEPVVALFEVVAGLFQDAPVDQLDRGRPMSDRDERPAHGAHERVDVDAEDDAPTRAARDRASLRSQARASLRCRTGGARG